jgi:hypothetical protein
MKWLYHVKRHQNGVVPCGGSWKRVLGSQRLCAAC